MATRTSPFPGHAFDIRSDIAWTERGWLFLETSSGRAQSERRRRGLSPPPEGTRREVLPDLPEMESSAADRYDRSTSNPRAEPTVETTSSASTMERRVDFFPTRTEAKSGPRAAPSSPSKVMEQTGVDGGRTVADREVMVRRGGSTVARRPREMLRAPKGPVSVVRKAASLAARTPYVLLRASSAKGQVRRSRYIARLSA
mmetsp:Transcript_21742/g.44005  ORF Transcript_21742/g.44005 Transcript_21742/m.44005 type:complete len:200 (-) Transcript_21742:51-650(-)